jgi:hypothetical protein
LALKARLVLKAKQVISKGRLEMDADCNRMWPPRSWPSRRC